jgi:drug/metabolite transporter (DMT)-like permease
MFINLKHNSPTVYLLVASSRLIMKSIAWQIQFKVSMSRGKQMSLLLIILGIMSQCFNYNAASTMEVYSLSDSTNVQSMETGNSRSVVLIVIQMMISVMVSVYNQRGVVKDDTFNEYLESIGLHVNSVVINMIISVCMLASRSDSSSRDASSVDWFGWKQWISSLDTLVIIISLAVGGLMSSQMMRYENSIVKGVVSASEIITVAIIQYVLFKDTLSLSDVMGILLVAVGVMLYRMPNQCSVERAKNIAKCSFFELVMSGCSLLVLICCLVMARNSMDGGLDSWSTSFRTKELSKHQYTVSSAQKPGIVACIR